MSPDVNPGCEHSGSGPWVEPVSTVTSFAFVLAGAAIMVRYWSRGWLLRTLGFLVVLVGVGSVVQHGPAPSWADPAHDAPLMALLAFVAADAWADVSGRRMRTWWWLVPSLLLVPLAYLAPLGADVVQGVVAGGAVVVSLVRALVRSALRRRLLVALGVLAVGGILGTLGRTGWPLCDPESLLQWHAVWHVLAAAAMWVLAPVVGERGRPSAVQRSRPARSDSE